MTTRLASRLAPLLALALAACGGGYDDDDGGDPAPVRASVTFVYVAPTAFDQAVAGEFPACFEGAGRTHLHAGWRGFALVTMNAAPEGDRWTLTLNDVPVGVRQSIRVNDPNACDRHRTGAVTTNVTANGVALTEVVDTPGNGTEPGLAFTVSEDGTVTP